MTLRSLARPTEATPVSTLILHVYSFLENDQGKLLVSQKLHITVSCFRRYWLALLCVTLSCGVLCVCDPYSSYSDRASSSNVWRELGWPALPDFRRPVNRRPYQSWSRSSYPFPRRGSLPATEEASDPHPRWSDARSASVPFETRVHDTQPNRYLARRPAPTTEIENARPKLYTSTGRRQGKQWLVPRRFLTSPGTGRGQGR